MPDLEGRFRQADDLPVEELWDDISTRRPRPSSPSAKGRTIVALSALGLATMAILIAFKAFGGGAPAGPIVPSFSPVPHANGDIAFVRGSMAIAGSSAQIYVVHPDGTDVRQITHGLHIGGGLAWSPEGRQIAFVQTGGEFGPSNIYVIDSDGSGLRQLTQGSRHDQSDAPSWSPDGSRIAFSASRFVGNSTQPSAIYLMDPSGGHLTRVAECSQPRCSNDGGYLDPAWSPDGSRIVFTESGDLLVVDLRTGRINTIVDCPDHEPGLCLAYQPSWSPDGHRILFALNEPFGSKQNPSNAGSTVSVAVVDADGRGMRSLFTTRSAGANILEPGWSPDGRFVVFSLHEAAPTAGSQLQSTVIVMDPDGQHQRAVVSSLGLQDQTCCPAWQPRP